MVTLMSEVSGLLKEVRCVLNQSAAEFHVENLFILKMES